MLLSIKHHSRYSYSEPVFLEPQYLNFHPQQRPHIQVESFNMDVSPEPDGFGPFLNVENNIQHQCWFNELLQIFEIEVHMKVVSESFDPFSFFIDFNNKDYNKSIYQSFLEVSDSLSEEIVALLMPYRELKEKDYLKSVSELLHYINNNWGHEVRYEEDIHSPSECFRLRNGSCRDLSWMMINMLRSIEIPSRFISGYAFNPELGEGHELHAWVECFIPGAGWIGVDPSAGIFVTEAYIPTAASNIPKATLPVSGTYRGNGLSHLETEVNIISEK